MPTWTTRGWVEVLRDINQRGLSAIIYVRGNFASGWIILHIISSLSFYADARHIMNLCCLPVWPRCWVYHDYTLYHHRSESSPSPDCKQWFVNHLFRMTTWEFDMITKLEVLIGLITIVPVLITSWENMNKKINPDWYVQMLPSLIIYFTIW